ncbi:hypothetical protein NW072_03220 [Mycoplasmopsis felis]|uniref:hypothetical protein n=1 Tax=Mycoplasmopsis felis TaxID=33923 RepID=UPI0021AEA52F|nr:hypothetical protein [Mycoplasmopsis felis]UWV80100.1 hypothetical protein NW072_03220 [Mycoplasmopsis felis]
MKKVWINLLLLSILPISIISCNNKETQKDYKNDLTVNEVLKKFQLNIESQEPKLSFDKFKEEYQKLNINDSEFNIQVSKLLSNNWVWFLSNIKLFGAEQKNKTDWFLFPEKEEAKHSRLFKRALGLDKIENENSIPHSHISFPKVLRIDFSKFTSISDVLIDTKDNQKILFITFGRTIIKLKLINNKIIVDSDFYFIIRQNKEGNNIPSNKLIENEILQTIFNTDINLIDQKFIDQYEDKITAEYGIPSKVYLVIR